MRQYRVVDQIPAVAGRGGMTVRKFNWNFKDIDAGEKYVLKGNSFQSYMLYALSLVFPPGERFFINALQAVRDRLPDEVKAEIKAFIGQEGQHGAAHDAFNKELERLGWDPMPMVHYLNENMIIDPGEISDGRKKFRLAMTAAFEHFTAVWGIHFLRALQTESLADKKIEDLLAWHALEEIEHKHVAFDAMKSLGISYPERVLTIWTAALALSFSMARGMAYFIRQDDTFALGKFLLEIGQDLTGRTPFSMSHLMVKGILSYMRPGFHPNDGDTLAEARALIGDRFTEFEGRVAK